MALPFNPVFQALAGPRREKQHGLLGKQRGRLSEQHGGGGLDLASLLGGVGGEPTGEPLAALRAAINGGGPEEFLGPTHPHRLGGPQQVDPHLEPLHRMGGHFQPHAPQGGDPQRIGRSVPPGDFHPHVPGIHWFGPGGSGVAYPGMRPGPLPPTRMAGSRGIAYSEPIRRLAALAGAAHGITPNPNLAY